MTSKLALYNLALGTYIGTSRITSLTEDVPQRYALDAVYDGALGYMLKRGLWKFALRTVRMDKDVALPAFHRQYAFTKPTDFVRISRISTDARLDNELLGYREDGTVFYSDVNPFFLQYVSDDAAYGMNLAAYPEAYEQAVASWLAYQSTLEVSKDRGDRADLLTLHRQTLDTARKQDAVDEPVKGKPAGRFTRSRTVGGSINGTLRGLRF